MAFYDDPEFWKFLSYFLAGFILGIIVGGLLPLVLNQPACPPEAMMCL